MNHFPAFRRCLLGLILCLCVPLGQLAAQESNPDAIIQAVMEANEPIILQSRLSPNGLYRAEVTVYPCVDVSEQEASFERLDLRNSETREVIEIASQLINCGGLGEFGLSVLRWSQNGAYLYYTDAREGTPDGLAVGNGQPVTRVRLDTSETEAMRKALFSMDGLWLVSWSNGAVRVISVNDDAEMTFAAQAEYYFTNVMWLPDSTGLVYVQADSPFPPITHTVVTYIDLTAESQTVWLEK